MNQLVYLTTLKKIRDSMPEGKRDNFDLQFGGREKSPTTVLVISLFFGVFGVDRFYIGNIWLGVGKLVTFGGFGVWALIDFFFIMGATRRKNLVTARETKMMLG